MTILTLVTKYIILFYLIQALLRLWLVEYLYKGFPNIDSPPELIVRDISFVKSTYSGCSLHQYGNSPLIPCISFISHTGCEG